jgi:predicted membrane protein
MKMGFINSGAFWGIIIILIGVSMVLRYVFNIHFPLFRIVIACLLIFWGLRMLMGSFGNSRYYNYNSTIFSNSRHHYDRSDNSYNVVFGRGELDLRNVKVDKNQKIQVNSVFGSYTIRIDDSIPVKIISNVAFGNIQTPDDRDNAFGKYTYRSSNLNEDSPYILIDANVVFGDLKVLKD